MAHRILIREQAQGFEVCRDHSPQHLVDADALVEIQKNAALNAWAHDPRSGRYLGEKLYQLLNGTGGLLSNIKNKIDTQDAEPVLRLSIPDALANLPFELLHDGSSFWVLDGQVTLIREVSETNRYQQPSLDKRPVNLLFMACSPLDTEPVLDFEAEEEAITQQIEDEKLPLLLRVEDSGSLQGLKFALRDFAPVDVLHLSGHAKLTDKGPVFQMESEIGALELATPDVFWKHIRRHKPRLLFLSGCETGKSSEATESFAQQLVRDGVSTVIGWGLPVSDVGATRFARVLYGALGEGLALDEAVCDALREVREDYRTAALVRVFGDGSALTALTDPPERVVHQQTRQETYRLLKESQVKVLDYGFVGRRRQVQTGIRVLSGATPGKQGLLITGTAGLGKSTLTGKLVERFRDRKLVIWTGAVEAGSVLSELERLFDALGDAEAKAIFAANIPYEERIKALLRGPFGRHSVLLIFDDFEHNFVDQEKPEYLTEAAVEVIRPFLEGLAWPKGRTQVIVTSRYPFKLETGGRDWVAESLERIPLMSFQKADLRKKQKNLKTLAENEHREKFLQFSGGNPRLLEQLAELAEADLISDLVQLEVELTDKAEEFKQKYLAKLLWAAQEPTFKTFLTQAAVFRTPVPAEAFASFGPLILLERAVALTLMEQEGGETPVYWVTPLLRETFWAEVADAKAAHQQAFAWYSGRAEEIGKLSFADLDACVFHGEHGLAMVGCWQYALWLAAYYDQKVLYREGVARLAHLLELAPLDEGAEYDEAAVDFLNGLAVLIKYSGDWRRAEPIYRQILAIEEAVLDTEDPRLGVRLNNLAGLLQDTNRMSEAEPLMRRALEIDEAAYGSHHPDVAVDLNNLAQLLQATNRMTEAEPLMRRALEIDEAAYGARHPNVSRHLNNLAGLLQETNRMTEAEPLMRRALEIDEAAYGVRHPRVAIDLNNLAVLYKATNRMTEAEPLMRRALEIDETAYGARHPDVARDLNNLAQLLRRTNRMTEAEPLMRRALEIDEGAYGARHPEVAIDLNNLAGLLQETNRMTEAEPLMRRALEIDEGAYGARHPKVAIRLNNLAGLFQDMGRLEAAEPLYRRAVGIFVESLGEAHPNTQTVAGNLAYLLKLLEEKKAHS